MDLALTRRGDYAARALADRISGVPVVQWSLAVVAVGAVVTAF
jgi:hypothetical protein